MAMKQARPVSESEHEKPIENENGLKNGGGAGE